MTAMTVRYHLDEHVDPAIAPGLKGRGIDVTTTSDAGLLGAADELQAPAVGGGGVGRVRLVAFPGRNGRRLEAS
jgi:hypothetical protein